MAASEAGVEVRGVAAGERAEVRGLSGERVRVSVLVAVGAVAAFVRFNDQLIGLTGDNATYILLARDLITGSPYQNAGYPWGYPAMLSPILAVVGPDNIASAIPWMKLLTALLFIAGLPVIYRLFRGRQGAWVAFATTLLYAVNSVALLHANDIMSEIPYVLASFGGLLLWDRVVAPWLDGREEGATPWLRLLSSGLLFVVAYYIRTVGMALFAAPVLVLLWYRRVKAAAAMGAMFLLLALPWLLGSRNSNLNSYADQLLMRNPYYPALGRVSGPPELVERVVSAAWLYITQVFPGMLVPNEVVLAIPGGALLTNVVFPVIAALMVGGLVLRALRRVELPEVYVVGFMLIVFAWPWKGDRFLLPIYPLLVFYVIEGLLGLAKLFGGVLARMGGRRDAGMHGAARAVGLTLLALALLPQLWLSASAASANAQYLAGRVPPTGHTPDWVSYFDACRWLKEHTPPGTVVMSRKTTLTTVYSSRPSVQIPLVSAEGYPAYIEEHGVEYILEDAFAWSTHTRNFLQPVLRERGEMFELVYTTPPPETRVWRVR